MSISDAVYPLRTFQEIITRDLTATNVTGSSIISGSSVYGKDAKLTNITATLITGSTSISGSTLITKGVTFDGSGTTSGSLVASLTLKVVVTGSTYYVQLWG